MKACLSSEEGKHEASFLQSEDSGHADGQGKGQAQSAIQGGEELGVKVAVEKSRKQKRSNLD
eukprot:8223980-Prorocentrum_lima.AAC.1